MTSVFVPEIWSARTAMHLDNALIYAQAGVVNRDYEGEIRAAGDTVRINQIGNVTVKSYTKNTDMADPESLTGTQAMLTVDQADYFNMQVDDIDQVQANLSLVDQATQRAAYAMASEMDAYVAGLMTGAVPSSNTIGSASSPKTDLGTASNAYKYLVDLGTLLDEQNVPKQGRFVIVPPWLVGVMRKDSTFLVATEGNVAINGAIGRAAGFNILESNNVPNTSNAKFKMVAGVLLATSVASQITQVESYRLEKRFADGVKGLQVYGGKVIYPNALAMLIANRPS